MQRKVLRKLIEGNCVESTLVFCWVDFVRCRDNWDKGVTPEWRDTLRLKVQGIRKAVVELRKEMPVANDVLLEIDAWLIGCR